MDKFVIRTPRDSPTSSPSKRRPAQMKQATIESLSGVVIIEELERAKIILERSDTKDELKVDTLRSLMRKNPAKDILLKTGIGKTVHKLCKDKNGDIAEEAKKVYKKWKENVLSKVNRPLMEVECDGKTKQFRRMAKQLLLGSLRTKPKEGKAAKNEEKKTEKSKDESDNKNTDLGELADYIEREVYHLTNRKAGNPYRRTIRKLVFSLRHKHELRISVLDSTLSVAELVKEHQQA